MKNSWNSILNKLDIALVFFNQRGEIEYYNNNICELWRIEQDFLENKPNLIEFFEVLREKHIYPEKDDFRKFCNNLVSLLKLKQPYENNENILLANAKQLIEKIIIDENGLLVLWEDNTDKLNLLYSLNSQKNTYQRILERNPQAIIVVGSNGVVENYNGKFLENMNIAPNVVDEKIHIRELIPQVLRNNNIDIEQYSATLIGYILGGRNFSYKIAINENIQEENSTSDKEKIDSKEKISDNMDTLLVYGIALSNGSMFVFWQKALSNNFSYNEGQLNSHLEKLHNDFILDLSTLVGSPLTTIIGFSELLQNEYIGELNLRQKEYLGKILDKAEFINQELNHKINLSNLEENTNITKETIDLNIILANLLYSVKPRIKNKNINIKLNIKESLNEINSNEELLSKSLSLLLLYIVEQNVNNATLEIEIKQNQQHTLFTIKDSAKEPLLSSYDLSNRYDLKLALKILEKLDCTLEYFYKNRSNRTLQITLLNS